MVATLFALDLVHFLTLIHRSRRLFVTMKLTLAACALLAASVAAAPMPEMNAAENAAATNEVHMLTGRFQVVGTKLIEFQNVRDGYSRY